MRNEQALPCSAFKNVVYILISPNVDCHGFFFVRWCYSSSVFALILTCTHLLNTTLLLNAIQFLHYNEIKTRNYPMDFSCVERHGKNKIWIELQWISKCVNKLVSENLFFWSFFFVDRLPESQSVYGREKSTEMLKYVWNTNKMNGSKKNTFFVAAFSI